MLKMKEIFIQFIAYKKLQHVLVFHVTNGFRNGKCMVGLKQLNPPINFRFLQNNCSYAI